MVPHMTVTHTGQVICSTMKREKVPGVRTGTGASELGEPCGDVAGILGASSSGRRGDTCPLPASPSNASEAPRFLFIAGGWLCEYSGGQATGERLWASGGRRSGAGEAILTTTNRFSQTHRATFTRALLSDSSG